MDFYEIYQELNWDQVSRDIYAKDRNDVERALAGRFPVSLEDFKTLLSPAAEFYLEEMAVRSRRITLNRFGKTIQLYAPLYLSNECANSCRYCGFNHQNDIQRVTLTPAETLSEARVIKGMGFDHVLLVAGESKASGLEYIKTMIEVVRPLFSNISIEIAPLKQEQYEELVDLGLHAVYVYQETYGPRYPLYHPKGRKSVFKRRLTTPDELGRAGVYKIGLGSLLGLDDWRVESWFLAAHLDYLQKRYWKTKYSISFPRLRPAVGQEKPPFEITDRQLALLICAYRLFNENVELSISTRESATFRDNIFQLGVTTMSAGSKTNPGGYSLWTDNLSQFEIEDRRSPDQVAEVIQSKGYCPVWKDWFQTAV